MSELDIGEVRQRTGLQRTGSDPDFRKRLAAKAAELDQRIEILAGMRDQLRHAVNCPSPRLVDCQHFQRYVDTVFSSPARRPPGLHPRDRY